MSLQLFAHPFSSYCQKVLVALYEKDLPFGLRMLDQDHPENGAELRRLWPIGKFPVLLDRHRPVIESTAIIEYLDVAHPGAIRLIPADPLAAVEVRMMDRIFDNYVMASMQAFVADKLRSEDQRDPLGPAQGAATLDTVYAWLDGRLGKDGWGTPHGFTLADCAAAPSLFYADWVHPIPAKHPRLREYRARLLARPSFARVVDEARPWRQLFPLGAPDRD